MTRIAFAALILAVVPAIPAPAQFGGFRGGDNKIARWKVELVTNTGETIAGVLAFQGGGPIVLDCDLGTLYLSPEKIRTIRVDKAVHENPRGPMAGMGGMGGGHAFLAEGEVESTTGRVLKGRIQLSNPMMEIDLGTLILNPAKLKEIRIMGPVEGQEPAAPEADAAKGQARAPSPIPRFLTRPR